MQTNLPKWCTALLSAMGVVMVAAMFVAWIDLRGDTMNGWRMAWDWNRWLLLVPVAGAGLAFAASTRSRHTRLFAVAAGVLITGSLIYDVTKDLLHADLATWLVLGGAGAMIAGIGKDNRAWRVGGGVAVLAGFFAPWSAHSLWDFLTSELARALARELGIAVRMLWLVPLAGAAGIVAGVGRHPASGKLSLAAGAVVFGAFLWLIGSAANLVLGWGAWATLGASTVALVIGVIAPGTKKIAAAVAPRA